MAAKKLTVSFFYLAFKHVKGCGFIAIEEHEEINPQQTFY